MRLFLTCLLLLISSFSYGDTNLMPHSENFEPFVFSKKGDIYYSLSNNKTIQITNLSKDKSPLLSPNKKLIVFIREGSGPVLPKACGDFSLANTDRADQIRIFDLETKRERLLVKNNLSCDMPEKRITDAENLTFSPDSKTLYFITSAWTTSSALHAVNVNGSHLRYIAPALEVEVVPKGDYKGYLIVYEHRLYVAGGSHDGYWLISPQGKEKGPLGPEVTADQREFLEAMTMMK